MLKADSFSFFFPLNEEQKMQNRERFFRLTSSEGTASAGLTAYVNGTASAERPASAGGSASGGVSASADRTARAEGLE